MESFAPNSLSLLDIQDAFRMVERAIAELRGDDNQNIVLRGDVDLGNKRIRNCAASRNPHDLCPRKELEEFAMYARDGVHQAKHVIIAAKGVKVPRATNPDGAVPLEQLTALVGNLAPKDAEYIVGAVNATLTNERVLTDTGTVTWDLTTPGEAKANVVGGSGYPPALGHAGI